MPAISASAPGKVILFGEHAVVYGQPAIAVPVNQVQAIAYILANPLQVPGKVRIEAPDIQFDDLLENLPPENPFSILFSLVGQKFGIKTYPSLQIKISSTIPIAAGLGSGAGVSIAVIRALSAFLGKDTTDLEVSDMAFQIEKIYHGNPSGIDNTVISLRQPIFYVKQQPIIPLLVHDPFTLIIADSGEKSSTANVVGQVRQNWLVNKNLYDNLFNLVGQISQKARQIIEEGPSNLLGDLMNENQALLKQIGVSTEKLDHLIQTALISGALGAKLSGSGGGGNIIALCDPDDAPYIADNLMRQGAIRTITTVVNNPTLLKTGN
jgi:mevalonate kinase